MRCDQAEIDARANRLVHPDGRPDIVHRMEYTGAVQEEMIRRGLAVAGRGPMLNGGEIEGMRCAYLMGLAAEQFVNYVEEARALPAEVAT